MTSPLLLAAAGEVGGDFFKERTSDTLPCQANRIELFCFDWARENIDRYGTPTVQHLEIVVFSVADRLRRSPSRWRCSPTAPAGCSRRCSAATGVLYTIPSIAFFFLLLPVTGFGRDTAIIVLSAYTLQIIYRNTMLGLDNVPDSVKDAARGMGLPNRQILWRVELPLAMPEIIAGLRVAIVSTIAIATLAVLISAGGLGTQMYGCEPQLPDRDHHRRRDRALMALAFHLAPADGPAAAHPLAQGESAK